MTTYQFDLAGYLAAIQDDFMGDVHQADHLMSQKDDDGNDNGELWEEGSDLLDSSVEKYFYPLLLNPWLYVKFGVYRDVHGQTSSVDINEVGYRGLAVPVVTSNSTISTGFSVGAGRKRVRLQHGEDDENDDDGTNME